MTEPPAATSRTLVAAKVRGHHLVHLASARGAWSLCGRPTRAGTPGRSFRAAGCQRCLSAAVEQGCLSALDRDQSWINLERLHLSTA